jgi:hypothetical protein
MKREVALWTEWAWSRSLVDKSEESLALFSLCVGDFLAKRFPTARRDAQRGLIEIAGDAAHTLKVLNYGGRRAYEILPHRRSLLEQKASDFRSHLEDFYTRADNLRAQGVSRLNSN